MTEREQFEIDEKRKQIFALDGYICRACNQSINRYFRPQIAHGISKSKANLKKYGAEIIHHEENLYSVCSLFCNDCMAVGKANEANEAERIKEIIFDTDSKK